MPIFRVFANVARELRDAVYRLRRRPVMTVVIVTMLGLAIGANGVIFSVVNAALIRPLPFASPDRLVVVGERTVGPRTSAAPLVSAYTFTEWRERNRSLESVASVVWWDSNIESGDTPRHVTLAVVSEDYFRLMGVQPMLGRSFLPEEIAPQPAPVLVISYEIWQSLGGQPDVVGQQIRLNGGSWTIIGVMPKLDYAGPFIGLGDIWIVQATNVAVIRERKVPWRGQQLIARLRDGVTIAQARADLASIQSDLARDNPAAYRSYETVVEPLQQFTSGNVARPLTVLGAAVVLILLIACANVANLLLAQATSRRRELALRAALGASPARLARETIAECAVLALGGGAAGLLLAFAATRVLDAGVFSMVPQLAMARVDGGLVAFTLGAALVTIVVCGVAPALTTSRRDAAEMLRDGTRASGDGRHADATRRALLAFQIALSLAVLTAAGLMTRTFQNLMGIDAGFRGGDALVFDVMLPSPRYPVMQQRSTFFRDLTQRLSAIPGIRAVGANRYFPLRERQYVSTVFSERSDPGAGVSAQYSGVTDGYLEAMGIRLTDGRLFTSKEMWDSSGTAIVGERLAKQLWPDRPAVGQRVKISAAAPWLTVIGVVADVRQRVLDDAPPPQIYVPYSDFQHVTMTFVVRTNGPAAPFAPAVIQTVRALDPVLPAFNILPLDELLARSQSGRRLAAQLLTAFAGLGLVLALFGVASVMSFVVARSRRELGVRLALGARPVDIIRMVIGQGLRIAGAGIVAGTVLALATTHALRGLLFNVSPLDPVSLGGAAVALTVVTVLACLAPAHRAARVEPLTTLRNDS